MQTPIDNRNIRTRRFLLYILLIIFAVIVMKCAWLCDDAYISFRTAKQIVNGNGAVWNAGERVQSYTNPLFLFLFTAVYAVTGEAYFTGIYLTAFLSVSAVYLVFIRNNREKPGLAALCILMLACSKAFVDYSTSGLENSMSYLIIAVFFIVYFGARGNKNRFLYLCLVSSFMAVNRIDAAVIFVPALAYEFFNSFKPVKILHAFIGFLPFIAWELFSLVYYGFPFPNTAYAKLNIMTPLADRIVDGFGYITSTFGFGDYVTVAGIVLGLIASFAKRDSKNICAGLGVLLYILYILYAGGDFMAGRFLTLPLFSAVIVLFRLLDDVCGWRGFVAVAVLIAAASIPMQGPLSSQVGYSMGYKMNGISYVDNNGICDERVYYYDEAGFYYKFSKYIEEPGSYEVPIMFWGMEGSALSPDQTVITKSCGFYGYFAPCEAYIVDVYALTNPLLARLPATAGQRTGHNIRWIPEGYIQSLKSGENRIEDESLHEYYDKLKLVISAPVFEKGRLRAILDFNLGRYDYLIDEYIENIGGVPDVDSSKASIDRAISELAG